MVSHRISVFSEFLEDRLTALAVTISFAVKPIEPGTVQALQILQTMRCMTSPFFAQ